SVRTTAGAPHWSATTTMSTSRTCRRRGTTSRRTWPTRRSASSPTRSSRIPSRRGSCGSAPGRTPPPPPNPSDPELPWFLWFCPGANHAPHHAPQDFIDKYRGKFDDGYEAYREWVLPRMIEQGGLTEGTELTPPHRVP